MGGKRIVVIAVGIWCALGVRDEKKISNESSAEEYVFGGVSSGVDLLKALANNPQAVKRGGPPGVQYGTSFQMINGPYGEPTKDPAYTDVEWVPDHETAMEVISDLKGTQWPGWRHSEITESDGVDFIYLYTGSGVYATNVERCARGAVGLTPKSSSGTVADIFEGDIIDATALTMKFTAGLAAALALLPVKQSPTLFRGSTESADMIESLKELADSGSTFVLPGLASTTVVREHAEKFMGMGPYRRRDGFDVLFEIETMQAKDVTHVNPGESEWILPPNREFRIVNTPEIKQRYSKDYYYVKLVDVE